MQEFKKVRRSRPKKVALYNLDGEYIKTYESLTEASEEVAKQLHSRAKTAESSISNCCAGRIKTAYNYIWKYAD